MPTLERYLTDTYTPWVESHRRTGVELVKRIRSVFPDLLELPLTDLTAWHLEKWRSARLRAGRAATTVNRDLNTIKAALNRAVEWNLLPTHPLHKVKAVKVDRAGTVRYLSPDEEKRIRDALRTRDEKRAEERARANSWRGERGYSTYPAFGVFTDHLTPLVLLALNTGMRRGEHFALRWTDVDSGRRQLTVRGTDAKSGQTPYIPLNTEAVQVLRDWNAGAAARQHVFSGRNGAGLADGVTLQRAAGPDALHSLAACGHVEHLEHVEQLEGCGRERM